MEIGNILTGVVKNFAHPATLFFFLGILAVFVKSDLEIPAQISKFLSIYLLFDIGIKGGEDLYKSGFGGQVMVVLSVCVVASFVIPFLMYYVLRRKFDNYNAGSIAAAYGSISAVTFTTTLAFLEGQGIAFSGYMVAGMALMESPAIIAGLILIRLNSNPKDGGRDGKRFDLMNIVKEALFNGSVFLLVGSLIIGYLSGRAGEQELKPFVHEIFFGMLSLYMLDMGLLAARRIKEIKTSGGFVITFATIFPPLFGLIGILVSYLLGYNRGDALLQTVLFASASYVAVPVAMRMSVPQANLSILLSMSLGITFTFNVSLGIPLYYYIINMIWG